MGDFTKQLTRKRMIKRPGAPEVDLDELRKQTPQGAIETLLSPLTCTAISTLAPAVATEVGGLLVALGDALARVAPPALRLDIQAVSQGWNLEVMNQGEVVYSRSAAMSPAMLCKLAIDGVTTWAHYAADFPKDPEVKGRVYRMWSDQMAENAIELEAWIEKVKMGDSYHGDSADRPND